MGQYIHKKFKRFLFLFFILAFILWMVWGNSTIEVSRFTIIDEKIPKTFDQYKIAHVADLHNKNWRNKLPDLIREEEPDVIVIVGDLIDAYRPNVSIAVEFVKQIQEVAPIYFVTGNHETRSHQYEELREALLSLGVRILNDEKVLLTEEAEKITLMGVKDPSYYIYPTFGKSQEEMLNLKIEQLTENESNYHILLSHRAEYFADYVQQDINLVLAGHAHGGQIRLPFVGGLYAPNQGYFPKYTEGVHSQNQTKMVVSRGLGNSAVPFRLNNRAELVFIELKSGE